MKVFIISGKSGSGKDTFAAIMKQKIEANNQSCVILHYADLVKFYAEKYYDWNGEKDEAGRTLLQQLGTNKIRKVYPEYWAEAIGKFLAAIATDFDYALIPDARFVNEIEIVKYYNPGAKTIRIQRYNDDGTLFTNPFFTIDQQNHPSEISLDDYEEFDYIVENRASQFTLLEESVETILNDVNTSL